MNLIFVIVLTVFGIFLILAAVVQKRSLERQRIEVAGYMKTIRELNILNEFSAALHESLNMENVLELIVDRIRELLRAEKSAVILTDKYKKVSEFYTSLGPTGDCKCELTGTLDRVINGYESIRLKDLKSSELFMGFPPNHPEIGSILMVPIILRGDVIGALIATDKKDAPEFSAEDEDLLLSLSFHAALAIEKVRFHEEIKMMASTDGLTGLNNHRTFQERLREEVERARRFKQRLSLLMIDIDHFKKFNDTYGHLKGDEVLKRVACIIQENIRSIDFAARYGGEEFSVILPQVSFDGAVIVAERIRLASESHELKLNGEQAVVTLSIGVASFPDDALTKDDLLNAADKALYLAKRTGRNRVCGFREQVT
ncbi:MAG: GGDEF domain-containing protein [Nitrospirae bacterium]|nr:MAG: GGDEF domain-containing protein [Nitrospirota bacterium]